MAMLFVGDREDALIALPDPSSMIIRLQDIDASSTTRSANGTLLRDRVCGAENAKRKIDLKWAYIRTKPARFILEAIKDEFFYVRYFDPYFAGERTALFYAGDREMPVYTTAFDLTNYIFEFLNVNLIEK